MNKRVLVVINPISGGNNKEEFSGFLRDYFTKKKIDFRFFYTSGKEDKIKLSVEIASFHPELVVSVGGDGTCNLVASLIVDTEIILGIIPLGSANGLASELKIPSDIEEASTLILKGIAKRMDTISINGRICIHICDIGMNARIIKRFDEEKVRGIFSYAKQFFRELWDARPSRYVFQSEEKTFKKKAHVVAIANASRYGTGVVINPAGKVDDGKFEVCIIKPYPFWGLFSIASAVFLGYLDKIRYAEINSYKKIKIFKKHNQPIHIDGEIIEETKVVEAFIKPASLRVIAGE
jgi:diacylglycerol kinase (ATP)